MKIKTKQIIKILISGISAGYLWSVGLEFIVAGAAFGYIYAIAIINQTNQSKI